MYFYELHEGDDDLFHDILLVHDEEVEPETFFELVQGIRRRVQDDFEDDTLIEAIAVALQRDHGFIAVTDDRLSAAVNVSTTEADNFLVELDEDEDDEDEDDEDEDEDDEADEAEFRTIVADFRPDGRPLD